MGCALLPYVDFHPLVGAGQSPLRFEKEGIGNKESRILTEADQRYLIIGLNRHPSA